MGLEVRELAGVGPRAGGKSEPKLFRLRAGKDSKESLEGGRLSRLECLLEGEQRLLPLDPVSSGTLSSPLLGLNLV